MYFKLRRGRLRGFSLAVLLLMTLISAAKSAEFRGKVVDHKSGEPLPGATIFLKEHQLTVVSGADGAFELQTQAGSYTLLVSLPGFSTAKLTVNIDGELAKEQKIELKEGIPEFGETMVVLGSRAKRTAIETPVPVDVIQTEALEQAGFTEVSQALQFLAPSFNASKQVINDGSDHVDPATLRGLNPDQVLVLLNGKRRHTSAMVHVFDTVGRGSVGVDLNAIPASAIERVEILRDGAAAQYGSDAIAGVMNLVLKSHPQGLSFSASGGSYQKGDGETLKLDVNYGMKIGERGSLNLTGEFRDRNATNRAGLDPRQQYPLLENGSLDPRELTFDRKNHRFGQSNYLSSSFFANLTMPFGEANEFYATLGTTFRDGDGGGFYRRALDERNIPEVYPDGFLPEIHPTLRDSSILVGVKNTIGAWNTDLSLTHGGNSFKFNVENSLNTSMGAVATPTQFYAGKVRFEQTTVNLDAFRYFDSGLSLAFGAEFRVDAFEQEAGEEASYLDGGVPDQYGDRASPGAQVFPGYLPSNEVDEDRNSFAVYGDLEWDLNERFLFGVAARFEDYSDFGNTFNGKVASRYEFTDEFAIRGAASTGFRAPSMQQIFFSTISTDFLNVDGVLQPFEVGTFRNNSELAQSFGIPELKEETSVNYSAGLTFQPNEHLSVTADFYQIDIEDRIVLTGTFRDSSSEEIAQILNSLDVSGAQFFVNAIDTKTQGFEFVTAFNHDAGEARIHWSAAFSYNDTGIEGEVQTPGVLAGLGNDLFDRSQQIHLKRIQPRDQANISMNYKRDALSFLFRATRFGSTLASADPTDPSIDEEYGAKVISDVDFSLSLSDHINVSVGGNNVFDVLPDKASEANNFLGIFPYSIVTSPFGFNGAYFYSRLSMKF